MRISFKRVYFYYYIKGGYTNATASFYGWISLHRPQDLRRGTRLLAALGKVGDGKVGDVANLDNLLKRNTPLHPSQEGIKKSRNDRGKDYRKAEEIRLRRKTNRDTSNTVRHIYCFTKLAIRGGNRGHPI
jgi:hypothetical protein